MPSGYATCYATGAGNFGIDKHKDFFYNLSGLILTEIISMLEMIEESNCFWMGSFIVNKFVLKHKEDSIFKFSNMNKVNYVMLVLLLKL